MARNQRDRFSRLLPKGVQKFYRQWRARLLVLRRHLTTWQMCQLVLTHFMIRPWERMTHRYVNKYYGGNPPNIFVARGGQHRATVILAMGLGHSANHGIWFARFLAFWFKYRVLLLRTPPEGNVNGKGAEEFFHGIARLNVAWVTEQLAEDYANSTPLFGVGFSKGGHDLTALAALLIKQGILLDYIITLSTPWQGSRLWRLSKLAGAHHFQPEDNPPLFAMEAIGHNLRLDWNVQFRFFCAQYFDQVVHRSDARFRRPSRERFVSVRELRSRWYYARTLWLQFGHTAFFNPLVFIQIGLEIQQCLGQMQATNRMRRRERFRQKLQNKLLLPQLQQEE